MARLVPVLVAVLLVFLAFKVIALLLPLLLLIAVIGVAGTVYLRSASTSDRQRLISRARRFLR